MVEKSPGMLEQHHRNYAGIGKKYIPILVENPLQIFGVVWNRQPLGAQGFPDAKTIGGGFELVRILMIGDERSQAA